MPSPFPGMDPFIEGQFRRDLQQAFTEVYDHAGYDYGLDYSAPTAPPLEPSEQTWVEDVLRRREPAAGG